ncbi:DUF2147 domain-containing protein [Anianabacter salinae]|uniref:DUF2147 domain-containing protein n=1 Tax=Anianabacter salinae TaxID=2851023 RepID=UPI00225DE622|nr:DUF2147 domain-containing protein [Anianabacter salinae]MBV0912881.1 DUF2147 domain-containing protein [Anianabacter salinae]
MMKFASVLALALGLASPAFAADPVEGIWKTEVDDGAYAHVAMTPCGDKLCGTIHRTFNASGEYESPNKGKVMVINMVPQGGGKYAGKVWRPSNDKIYTGKMELQGDALKLSGCIAGGLLCSAQDWQRVQ